MLLDVACLDHDRGATLFELKLGRGAGLVDGADLDGVRDDVERVVDLGDVPGGELCQPMNHRVLSRDALAEAVLEAKLVTWAIAQHNGLS